MFNLWSNIKISLNFATKMKEIISKHRICFLIWVTGYQLLLFFLWSFVSLELSDATPTSSLRRYQCYQCNASRNCWYKNLLQSTIVNWHVCNIYFWLYIIFIFSWNIQIYYCIYECTSFSANQRCLVLLDMCCVRYWSSATSPTSKPRSTFVFFVDCMYQP